MADEVEYVTITKGRLDYLMSRHNKLTRLEAAGVDNWEGPEPDDDDDDFPEDYEV